MHVHRFMPACRAPDLSSFHQKPHLRWSDRALDISFIHEVKSMHAPSVHIPAPCWGVACLSKVPCTGAGHKHAAQVLSITFNFHPCVCSIRVRGQVVESLFITPQPIAHFLCANRCLMPGMVLSQDAAAARNMLVGPGCEPPSGPILDLIRSH